MAESVFPFIDQYAPFADTTGVLPIPREYAWDFNNDCMLMTDGKVKIVTEADAVKVWAMKALRTARYRYLAYTWNYGNELESLIGHGLSQEITASETTNLVRQALLLNPYIEDIQDIIINHNDSKLSVSCTLITRYGEVPLRV